MQERFWLYFVLVLLIICGCGSSPRLPCRNRQHPSTTETSDTQKQALETELKDRICRLLEMMMSNEYKEREEAAKELSLLLERRTERRRWVLLDYLQRRFEESEDAEVRLRLERILDPYLRPWKFFVKLRVLKVKRDYDSGSIRSLTFSPNNQLVAAAMLDSVVIWNPRTGECLRRCKGHLGDVETVAFSPDGRLLVSGGCDNTVRVWNPQTAECLRCLKGHTGWVTALTFSPDGRLLASGDGNGIIRIWNPYSGRCLRAFKAYDCDVTALSFSPDEKSLASGGYISTKCISERGDEEVVSMSYLCLWDPRSGKRLQITGVHKNPINALAFSPNGEYLAGSVGEDICIWNIHKGRCKQMRLLQGHQNIVTTILFTLNGRVLVSGSWDTTIRMWDPYSGKCLRVLEEHTAQVWALAVSADGDMFASGDNRGFGEVIIWGVPEEDEKESDERK